MQVEKLFMKKTVTIFHPQKALGGILRLGEHPPVVFKASRSGQTAGPKSIDTEVGPVYASVIGLIRRATRRSELFNKV